MSCRRAFLCMRRSSYRVSQPRWFLPIAGSSCWETSCARSRMPCAWCGSLSWGRSQSDDRPATEGVAMRARNRELVALLPASLLLTAGFAGVFIQRSNFLSNASLTYGAIFLGLCLLGHVVLRLTLPNAD